MDATLMRLIRRVTRWRHGQEERRPALTRGRLPAASLQTLAMMAPLRSFRDTTGTSRVPGARQPYPPPAAVEPRAGPLLCMYSRADGWREATCPVCLSDMEDGETLRVLPACMHYFHDACVGEWLRGHNTCPLCRAAPEAAEDG